MISEVVKSQVIPTGGATVSIAVTDGNTLYIFTGTGALSGNITMSESGTPFFGCTVKILWLCTFTLGGQSVTIFGKSFTATQVLNHMQIIATYDGSAWQVLISGLFGNGAAVINTADIVDGAITNPKLVNIARGSIIVGGVANAPSNLDAKGNAQILIGDGTDLHSVAVTGDIGLTNGGVSSISAGVIINADINASAAIVFSKMETGTAANIIVFNSGGVPTKTAMSGDATIDASGKVTISNDTVINAQIKSTAAIALTKLQNVSSGNIVAGNGSNQLASVTPSGVVAMTNAGVFSFAGTAGKLMIQIPVSFVTASQCKNSIKLPFAGTIDFMFATVTTALGGSDSGTITASIAGTPVTGGVITLAASSALDTQATATPSAAKTFAADQQIDFASLKTTTGGTALLTVYVTRT